MADIFTNTQWAFDNEFFHTSNVPPDPDYFFSIKDLLERHHLDNNIYEWPRHVCEKTWVDKIAFLEAFEKAVAHFYPGQLDKAAWAHTLLNI